jgi:predicted nucleotide-binding protein (sugar kinase/HSP70/actin superfamily)
MIDEGFSGPDHIDLEKFTAEYAQYVRNVNDVRELLKIPFERHEANFRERLDLARKCLEKIRYDVKDGDGHLESLLRGQYYHFREQANSSIKQIMTYQGLYVFLETEVHSKLEEALVLQHLSKAGADLMEQANKLKTEASKNIQDMVSKLEDLGISLPTISRAIGIDEVTSNPAGTSEDPSTNPSLEDRKKIYDKDIDAYLENTDDDQSLPPADGQ